MAATPDAQADPYVWAAALLGHFVIGLVLVAALSAIINRASDWIDEPGAVAWVAVVGVYFIGWEAGLQHFGAGFVDALVDTFAVAVGGAVGLFAWARNGLGVTGSILALLAVLWRGVKR
jgi:hypothetical protein